MGATEQGIFAGRWQTIPRTLCFLRNGEDILLMKRSAHKRVFPGRCNGIGGHIERDETPLAGALREIEEEAGISSQKLRDIRLRAVYNIDAGQETGIMMFVYTAEALTRQVGHTDEGTLMWVPYAQAFALPLVEDIPHLLPRLFGPQAQPGVFYVHMHYDDADQMVIQFEDVGWPNKAEE
jgi:8-oxo-dGTP diphosphatase